MIKTETKQLKMNCCPPPYILNGRINVSNPPTGHQPSYLPPKHRYFPCWNCTNIFQNFVCLRTSHYRYFLHPHSQPWLWVAQLKNLFATVRDFFGDTRNASITTNRNWRDTDGIPTKKFEVLDISNNSEHFPLEDNKIVTWYGQEDGYE